MNRALGLLGVLAALPYFSYGQLVITNPGFEDPPLADGDFTVGVIPGWSATNPGSYGVFTNVRKLCHRAQKPNVAYSYSIGGTITQTLSDLLTAGQDYTLSVKVGARLDANFAGYTIELRTTGGLLSSTSVPNPVEFSGTFVTAATSYSALPGDPRLGESLQISLISNGAQAGFDDVSLVALVAAPVPEPEQYAVVAGLGLLIFAAYRCRFSVKQLREIGF
jgi:hypothetical protein